MALSELNTRTTAPCPTFRFLSERRMPLCCLILFLPSTTRFVEAQSRAEPLPLRWGGQRLRHLPTFQVRIPGFFFSPCHFICRNTPFRFLASHMSNGVIFHPRKALWLGWDGNGME